jgi:hypothetical protein
MLDGVALCGRCLDDVIALFRLPLPAGRGFARRTPE